METWISNGLYAFLRTSTPYHELPQADDLVLEMLSGRYADTRLRELKPRVSIDRPVDNTVQAGMRRASSLYSSGGTIPERGYFDLRIRDSKAKIGELDEEFDVGCAPSARPLRSRSQLWRIEDITHNDVLVSPTREARGSSPSGGRRKQNRDFHFSERIGLFLEHADSRLESDEFRTELTDRFSLDTEAAEELIGYLKRQQKATGAKLPHRHHLLIEHVAESGLNASTRSRLILHTLWGGRVNRPFALALSAAWRRSIVIRSRSS